MLKKIKKKKNIDNNILKKGMKSALKNEDEEDNIKQNSEIKIEKNININNEKDNIILDEKNEFINSSNQNKKIEEKNEQNSEEYKDYSN